MYEPIIYEPNFCPQKANKLVLTCMKLAEQESPDVRALFSALSELAALIESAVYDNKVLKNLITENQILGYTQARMKASVDADIANIVSSVSA